MAVIANVFVVVLYCDVRCDVCCVHVQVICSAV